MVQMLHNDSVVHPWQSCSTILHTVHNVSYSDKGSYICRVLDASNHTCDRPLGNLSAIGMLVSITENDVIIIIRRLIERSRITRKAYIPFVLNCSKRITN